MDAFQSIKFTKSDSDHILDDIVSFADLYNVQSLENRKLDSTAQVTVAMLEDIYYLLTDQFPLKSVYNQSDNNTPLPIKYNKNLPIEYFDAIFIVDSEYAYQNRWKSLFLYFDTPIISTTGNPPQEVQEFFPQEFIQAHQKLPATIKSVRDLLRKDAGLSGDADRLPQLTWLLLLKYLDDFELAQEEMHGVGYTPIIEKPYRWRDWVQGESQKDRETGDNLLRFVNNELTPYLQTLSGENNRDIHTIVGTIFKGTFNRMRSGYLLRDVVNKLNTINFNTSNDIHAISLFYETMLKETRDAAGDAGEFYTPRPIIHFIIDRLNPQLGERIMDPACGTAGFLVEAYARIKEQVKTTQQQQLLFDSLIGIEKKPIPYLLGIMNLLLHGIEAPNVVECNALTVNQIPDADQVNIVATNPPFGGEEDPSILDNFPVDIRTHETALLFFQYIMTLLKHPSGRCGIVLPNGFLFGSGIAAKVKETLLREFNLHTIVRLPRGIFAPYTNIPTNILFFETGKDLYPSDDLYPAHDLYPSKLKTNTQEIWYYEIPLPEGRNSYSKTKPIQNEAFQGCIDWWDNRTENEHAWKVPVKEIIADNYNLDRKHPVEMKDPEHFSSVKSLDTIIARERHNITVMESIRNLVEWKKDLIGTTFNQPSEEILLSLISTYCLDALQKAGITQQSIEYISILKSGYRASNSPETHGPLFIRASDINGDNIDWSQVSHKSCSNPNQYILKNSDILIVRSESGIIGRACLIKHVPEQAIFSSSLVRLRLIQDISPEYIYWCLQSQQFWQEITREITGTDIRSITIKAISRLQFPIPSLKTQNILVTYLNNFKDRLQSEKYSELDMQTLLQKIDTFIADNAEL
jgi:type I restriction enzyme M protein